MGRSSRGCYPGRRQTHTTNYWHYCGYLPGLPDFLGIYHPHISATAFLFSFISGAFWAFGQINQYKAFAVIGVSRAMPISTGLQLASTSLLGVLAFGEWPATVTRYIGLLAVTIIIVGIILTTWQQKKPDPG
ncbi:GRP family sugar transporter [Apirhabdus apintestini]|nr:GRP family sugar transporter [Enterobacteriaceae bacterium CA-0114]